MKKNRDFWENLFKKQAEEVEKNLSGIDIHLVKIVPNGAITKKEVHILRQHLILIDTVDQFILYLENKPFKPFER